MTGTRTVAAAIADALDAYETLAGIGESIDDEWTYVTDLSEAWRSRLEEIAATRDSEILEPTIDGAIDRAIDEIGRISDPHRAIDWLSTFPQVVLVALGDGA